MPPTAPASPASVMKPSPSPTPRSRSRFSTLSMATPPGPSMPATSPHSPVLQQTSTLLTTPPASAISAMRPSPSPTPRLAVSVLNTLAATPPVSPTPSPPSPAPAISPTLPDSPKPATPMRPSPQRHLRCGLRPQHPRWQHHRCHQCSNITTLTGSASDLITAYASGGISNSVMKPFPSAAAPPPPRKPTPSLQSGVVTATLSDGDLSTLAGLTETGNAYSITITDTSVDAAAQHP